MTLYAGDRSPKAIGFEVAMPGNGMSCELVRLRVKNPRSGAYSTWELAPATRTATKITLVYVLEADGSSVPDDGQWWSRAWCYDAGDVLIHDSDDKSFPVEPSRFPWPT